MDLLMSKPKPDAEQKPLSFAPRKNNKIYLVLFLFCSCERALLISWVRQRGVCSMWTLQARGFFFVVFFLSANAGRGFPRHGRLALIDTEVGANRRCFTTR